MAKIMRIGLIICLIGVSTMTGCENRETDNLRDRAAVWDRVLNGTGSEEDHRKVEMWQKEFETKINNEAAYHEAWLRKHGEEILVCWDSGNYRPEATKYSEDTILLFAVCYGISDIQNGGFAQFYGNDTGAFAPELDVGLDRLGFTELALIVRSANSTIGTPFPRERYSRASLIASRAEKLEQLSQSFFREFNKVTKAQFTEKFDTFLRNSLSQQ